MKIKNATPWWLKIVLKLTLSRLPISYEQWRKINLFKHGPMESPAYAFEVFTSHFAKFENENEASDFTCLELGPGDSLFGALIARAYGANKTYLIDSGDYAHQDISPYVEMGRFLKNRGFVGVEVDEDNSLESLLRNRGGIYITSGLEGLRTIDDAVVDFVWSQAVLEHVKKDQFLDTMKELRRVVKPSSISSHRIDLKDHLDNALNNLRFSEKTWESSWMSRSGFYTNRIRYTEMLNLFVASGFRPTVNCVDRWDTLPTPRGKLCETFRSLDDQELRVSGFNVVLHPA